jgi:hypothetical protein
MLKLACVAVVRNEARHIAEWLAWQFALGFDTVLLLDNLSTDDTRAKALAFAPAHDVRVVEWPERRNNYQVRGYEFAVRHLDNQYDWIAFFDTDEFLVLDEGLTLRACLAAREDAAAIAVPWAIFGSSGHRAIPRGLVVEAFQWRGPASFGPNQHIKSIIRPKLMQACETAHSFAMDGTYTDLAGRPITWMIKGVQDGAPDYRLGKLHHYFTRSWEHWMEKMQRGYPDTARKLDDFNDYDVNQIFDDSVRRLLPEMRAILAGAMDKPRLAAGVKLTVRAAADFTVPVRPEDFAAERNARAVIHPAATTEIKPPVFVNEPPGGVRLAQPVFLPPTPGPAPAVFPRETHAPDLTLTRLNDVLCLPGQIAICRPDDPAPTLLVESLSEPWLRNTPNLRKIDQDTFALRNDPPIPVHLAGKYLYLDNMFPEHFGHFMIDVLQMAWGYHAAVRLGIDDLRVLIGPGKGEYVTPLLHAAGIPAGAITRLTEPARCEELFFATKAFQFQGWTSPGTVALWTRLRNALDEGSGPERVYISRSRNTTRSLVNERDAEAIFRDRGFLIVHPQEFPIRQQVTLWANAKYAAGCSGSNMFGLAFQRRLAASFIMVSPNFVQRQEGFLQAGHAAETSIYLGEALGPDVHDPWRIDPADLEKHVDRWLGAAAKTTGTRRKLAPGRVKAAWLAVFDEDFYLTEYPDVRSAVATGAVANGQFHYEAYGFNEGRQGFAFDPVWYAGAYPEVLAEIAAGNFLDCEHHYAVIGRLIGCRPLP